MVRQKSYIGPWGSLVGQPADKKSLISHLALLWKDLPQENQSFFIGRWLPEIVHGVLGLLLSDNPLEKNLEFFQDPILSFAAPCVALEAFFGSALLLRAPPARAQLQRRALRGAGLGWARAGGAR